MRQFGCTILAACSVLSAAAMFVRADEARTVKLKFVAGGSASAVYTPSKLLRQGKEFRFGGSSGNVKVAGQRLLVAGRYVGDGYLLGIDCNADGKVAGSEWVRVNLITHVASFAMLLPAGDARMPYAIRVVRTTIGVQANRVSGVSGRMLIDGCMVGSLEGLPIRLFDDDLSGTYTQDGEDAIAIGASPAAMPLRRDHQIGRHHYTLEVKSDGSEIAFRRQDDLELGAVDVPVRASLVRHLILEDETNGRCYDVKASGAVGVPAGTYRLAYAVLGAGKRIVVAGPTAKSLDYTVAANVVNILRFGPPVRLTFGGYYHQQDQQLRVRTDIVPHGIGGERYHMDFAGYHRYGENPNVTFRNGRVILTNGHMSYDGEDRLLEFAAWVPKGLNRKTGRIVMACQLPVLGQASGARSLDDVLSGKRAEAPDPKRPAVATRKLPDGVALGSKPPPPKPKPKPKPKPEPKVAPKPPPPPPKPRPTRPRSEDPEYDAATALDVARAFLKQGRQKMGIAKLKEVVKKYPKTAAGKQADDLLLDIEVQAESGNSN